MELNNQELLELFENESNITHVSKKYAELKGIEYTDYLRRRISTWRSKNMSGSPDSYFGNETSTETVQYSNDKQSDTSSFMPSAWDNELKRFLNIDEYCDKYGLPKESVRSSKLVSHNSAHMVYNIAFHTPEEEAMIDLDQHLEEVVSKFIKPIKSSVNALNHLVDDWFDRLVYSDTHINMDVNGKDGTPLYDGKWDNEEIFRRLDLMVQHVKTFQKSKVLLINDLGDFMDGLAGYTTRGGHQLPQLTSDKEAFETGIEFKLRLIDSLIDMYDKIIIRDTVNDNHSGIFSSMVSSAANRILKERYGNKVEAYTLERFITHYSIGKHTFIESHGKDKNENRFNGFKVTLDTNQIEKIDQYCKEHKLYNGNFIEFSKGNDHQSIYDDTTSNDFSFYSYLAFSPPSNYIKTNFKCTKSGFRFYNIHKEQNIKITIPYFF